MRTEIVLKFRLLVMLTKEGGKGVLRRARREALFSLVIDSLITGLLMYDNFEEACNTL